jgi:hypothetical protein
LIFSCYVKCWHYQFKLYYHVLSFIEFINSLKLKNDLIMASCFYPYLR